MLNRLMYTIHVLFPAFEFDGYTARAFEALIPLYFYGHVAAQTFRYRPVMVEVKCDNLA
jgi:hypothetical protein